MISWILWNNVRAGPGRAGRRITSPRRFLFTIQKPLPPPNGYNSWLDYAVECFETRDVWLESHFNACFDEKAVELDREDIRESARLELRALRKAATLPHS
ncbi:hypothetical protein M0765_023360 [Variovorax sp. S2]|nr:hypothetical protein [Variovorax sp. S12S4]